MKVTVTIGELLDRDVWTKACKLTGLNEWVVNEGLMDREDTVDLTMEEAVTLGLEVPQPSERMPDPEVQVMETICTTLAPLDTAACQRIVSEVARRFGITLTPLGEK